MAGTFAPLSFVSIVPSPSEKSHVRRVIYYGHSVAFGLGAGNAGEKNTGYIFS